MPRSVGNNHELLAKRTLVNELVAPGTSCALIRPIIVAERVGEQACSWRSLGSPCRSSMLAD